MFELITTFYNEQNIDRRNEFLQALKLNAENTKIHKVYILCESGEEFIRSFSPKIEIVKCENRPKFKDLILFANTLSTLSKALHVKEKEVYCLTRWNQIDAGQIEFFLNFKSQDSWIFKGILPDNIGAYFMGVPGCDNRLAAELVVNGFKISNPSLSVHSIHLHATEKRTYHKVLDRVSGEYAYCLPKYLARDTLNVTPKKLYFLVRRKYYNALFTKTLEGVEISLFDRFKSFFYLNYYKLRLKLI